MSDDFADLSSDLSADAAVDPAGDGGSLADDLMSSQFADLTGEDPAAEPPEPAAESVSDAAGAGFVDVSYGDSNFYAGEASFDADGDGTMDTAVQETVDANGQDQVEYYIDEDGDHQADQLIITDPDGNLVSNEVVDDATGEFVETEFTGELGPDGPSIADTAPPAAPADATTQPPSGLRGGGPA